MKQQLNKELTADFSILAIFTLGYSVYVAVSIKLHTKRELNALEAKIREATSDTDASQILSARTSTLTTTPDLYASLTNIRHKAEKYAKQELSHQASDETDSSKLKSPKPVLK